MSVSDDGSASPARNFTLSLEERIRGFGDPPAYSVRLRTIETLEGDLLAELSRVLEATPSRFERAIATVDFARLNRLIENHNRYFPIEANLPIDFATGKPRTRDGVFQPRPLWTREALRQAVRARSSSR